MLITKPIKILLVEDEDYDVRRVKNTLKLFENMIQIRDVVSNGTSAVELLKENRKKYDVVIMDYQIAGRLKGEELIRQLKSIVPSIQIIVITKMTINITDFEFASNLMRAGASWYCTKYPGDIEQYIYQPTDFILSIINAYEKKLLDEERHRSNKKLSQNIDDILKQKIIIGVADSIKELQKQIEKCAQSNLNVLITGPSGTGKELVANNIHYKSDRKFEKFVPINCGSLPHELIESELFGYEKGAFTGAESKKKGLFEIADHGTIFLDEIAELPAHAQVKLLRVIQEGEIEKIGRTDKIKVDVRIIAATNKDLAVEVAEKRFREDLFYRLAVLPIKVLPLNERSGDIPLLVEHFIRIYADDLNKKLPTVDSEAIKILSQYSWPGNVRELKNVVQRLLFNSEGEIGAEDIKAALMYMPSGFGSSKKPSIDFTEDNEILPLREMEKKLREKYFRFVRENSSSDAEAAKKLGLAPPNYHRMCKELGIK